VPLNLAAHKRSSFRGVPANFESNLAQTKDLVK